MPFQRLPCRSPDLMYTCHSVRSSNRIRSTMPLPAVGPASIAMTVTHPCSQHRRYAFSEIKKKSNPQFLSPILLTCLQDVRDNTSSNTQQRSRMAHVKMCRSIASLQCNSRASRTGRSLRSGATSTDRRSSRRRNNLRDSRAGRVGFRGRRGNECDFSHRASNGTSSWNASLSRSRSGDSRT